MTLISSTAILAGVLMFLCWERMARDRALAAIPTRIHVNGTRGKSTVTRLVAAVLREAGVRTVAKTTGTEPRLILPDGSERVVRRRGPASIREQLWLMREARRMQATAVVVECMAVDPEYQAISESQMIRSTLGVITNARLDHAEAMGPTVDDVAGALASTVPSRAALVLGPSEGTASIARIAASRGTRVILAQPEPSPDGGAPGASWEAANVGVALAVARELGIGEDVARQGIQNARPDPGALRRGVIDVAGRRVDYLDASAANDPQSLGLILGPRQEAAVFVFHHRADRPARLRQFGQTAPWSLEADRVIVTGDQPDWSTWRRLRRQLTTARVSFCPPPSLAAELRRSLTMAPAPALVVFCGNTKGFRVDAIVAGLQQA